jgi:hypothetical protein
MNHIDYEIENQYQLRRLSVKKFIIPILILGLFVGVLYAREYRLGKYVQEGLYPSAVIVDALDSSAAARSQVIEVITDSSGNVGNKIDTVFRTQLLIPIAGINHDSVPVSAESTFTPLYVVPATGVTSVTIKNISIIAEKVPHTHGAKMFMIRIGNVDATDSAYHHIIIRTLIDSAGGGIVHGAAAGLAHADSGLLVAFRPRLLLMDSTANAVLYPGDAVWSVTYCDSANVYTKDLSVMLNVSINK